MTEMWTQQRSTFNDIDMSELSQHSMEEEIQMHQK